jgi:hypothetical protein
VTPKAKLQALLDAQLVLRDLALDGDQDSNPILNYRCHEASMEIGKIRQELRAKWGIKTLVLCAVCLVAGPAWAVDNILEWEAGDDKVAQYQIFYGLDYECDETRYPLEKSVARFDKSIRTYKHTITKTSGRVCYEVLAWDAQNYSSVPSSRVTKNLDAPGAPKNFQVK